MLDKIYFDTCIKLCVLAGFAYAMIAFGGTGGLIFVLAYMIFGLAAFMIVLWRLSGAEDVPRDSFDRALQHFARGFFGLADAFGKTIATRPERSHAK